MSALKPTPATQAFCKSAAILGLLLCVSAHATPAPGSDVSEPLLADTDLHSYFLEARGGPFTPARRTISFEEFRQGEAAPVGVRARLPRTFGSDLPLPGDPASEGGPDFLLRNPDAFVRAKIALTLGRSWPGFAYADMGAVDSAVRWQGMAGIRAGHGFDVLGGWRHITYHFHPGMGFDSLDFNGPFLGATLAW